MIVVFDGGVTREVILLLETFVPIGEAAAFLTATSSKLSMINPPSTTVLPLYRHSTMPAEC